MCAVPRATNAQAPQYVAVTTDSLRALAQQLKQNLQDGSIRMADMHAMQLRLALLGVLREELSNKIDLLDQTAQGETNEPKWTVGLVPVADQLINALDEPDLSSAKKYVEQLRIQIHAQHELYIKKQLASTNTGDAIYDRFSKLSHQLGESLRTGDIARATVLAADVQGAHDALSAKTKYPFSSISRNVYNINDSLGRAAFLAKDYTAAGDYLLKAADTPGEDPALRTFGPDLWLARALLGVGYKDVVLTFLERCKVFWPKPQLDEWISVIQSGGTPDLSHNIFSAEPVLSR